MLRLVAFEFVLLVFAGFVGRSAGAHARERREARWQQVVLGQTRYAVVEQPLELVVAQRCAVDLENIYF